MTNSALPRIYIKGEFFAIDSLVADYKRLQNKSSSPIIHIVSIVFKNLAHMWWNMFMTRGHGTWIPSRSETMCPDVFHTLRGRKDVIPLAFQQMFQELAMSPRTDSSYDIWGDWFFEGGLKTMQRTVKCPKGRTIYRRGTQVTVPFRQPRHSPAEVQQMTTEIATWLIENYFQRGRKYAGMVHGMRYVPFTGTLTGREMSGITPIEAKMTPAYTPGAIPSQFK